MLSGRASPPKNGLGGDAPHDSSDTSGNRDAIRTPDIHLYVEHAGLLTPADTVDLEPIG